MVMTIADVFNPLDAALKVQQIDEARTRSRLLAMQEDNMRATNKSNADIMALLQPEQAQPGPQMPSPQAAPQPQQPSPGMGSMSGQMPSPQPQAQAPQGGQLGAPGQGQPQQGKPNPQQMKIKALQAWTQKALSSGDNATLQQVVNWGRADPDLKTILEKSGLIQMTTPDKNNLEMTANLSEESIAKYKQAYPQIKDALDKPGTYELKFQGGAPFMGGLPVSVKKVSDDKNQSQEQLISRSLKGDKEAQAILDKQQQLKKQEKQGDIEADVKTIGDAIMRGEQSPVISGFGMAKIAAPLKAYLAKQGYNLKNAELDFKATEKHLATLNGAQQTRLRQATQFAYDSLPLVENLAKEWNGGNFPIMNKVNLMAAKNGAYGPKAQDIATKLTSQITDMQSELAVVYKGGNSPTDQGLQKAADMLKSDWAYHTIMANTDLIRKNLGIRLNSMNAVGVAGLSTEQPQAKPTGGAPEAGMVKGGYRFKGGDPSKQENWEKI